MLSISTFTMTYRGIKDSLKGNKSVLKIVFKQPLISRYAALTGFLKILFYLVFVLWNWVDISDVDMKLLYMS